MDSNGSSDPYVIIYLVDGLDAKLETTSMHAPAWRKLHSRKFVAAGAEHDDGDATPATPAAAEPKDKGGAGTHTTHVVKQTLNPYWNQKFVCLVAAETDDADGLGGHPSDDDDDSDDDSDDDDDGASAPTFAPPAAGAVRNPARASPKGGGGGGGGAKRPSRSSRSRRGAARAGRSRAGDAGGWMDVPSTTLVIEVPPPSPPAAASFITLIVVVVVVIVIVIGRGRVARDSNQSMRCHRGDPVSRQKSHPYPSPVHTHAR